MKNQKDFIREIRKRIENDLEEENEQVANRLNQMNDNELGHLIEKIKYFWWYFETNQHIGIEKLINQIDSPDCVPSRLLKTWSQICPKNKEFLKFYTETKIFK